ncbi:MAG: RagB/SusD family nutrient uptake outer membrane protein [Dysgonamonadaceae bacterium]|jgi:hypothetical protein|nr:RagB/SusD family nutrient uptake outer membrane protein [Dysgonamonadaceae bacterium]
MKSIKYLNLILLSAVVACSNLEPISYSEINPSIFPQTEADVQALVMSCYYPLRGDWGNGINHNSERGQMFVNDCCTEILAGTFDTQKMCHEMSYNENHVGVTFFYYRRFGGGDGFLEDNSDGFANKISRCTLVMDAIENSNLSREKKDKYLAEVRCARGYLAYILFDMYGPLVVAPLEVLKNPLKEAPLPRLTNEEMVKFIEDDLVFAGEYLPFPKQAEYGRFSRGLAKTLLIRLYLHETVHDKAYYNKVETIAREVMTAEYGYDLVPEYTTLFQFAGMTKSNPEYIFVIPATTEGPNKAQWQTMVMPGDERAFFTGNSFAGSTVEIVKDGTAMPNIGWGTIQSTWYFYDSFESDDTRKTYFITEYKRMDSKGQFEVFNRANPWEKAFSLGPLPQKYQIDNVNSTSNNLDCVQYRYPEILLSLAEAIVMKPGGSITQEAVDLMNRVRKRAHLGDKQISDFPSTDVFIDQILLERSHEFWCENGQYRADLIRFDKLLDHVMIVNNGIAPYASKDKYLFPLPLSVIVDGKGKVKQNPGYGE